ncbi:MAG: sigma-70 family RNA polymerase sigma factor [Ruminococcus sp.]|nr:sigma-70 family RNA polymerase sigma factor [Ruminococcus sp.]
MKEILNRELMENTYLFCKKRLSDSEEAKDLAQDILLEAVRALSDGREIIGFYSWYWRMARNKYADRIRRKRSPNLPLEATGGVAADITMPAEKLIAEEDISALNYSLSRLASVYREIMIRFYLREQSVNDIAAELGIPAGTVKGRLFDGRKKLKERFDNMDNIGKYSYAPALLDWFWGGGISSASRIMNSSKIVPQAMVICRSEAKSVNEIADEMGVAPVYLEEFLYKMEDEKLLISHVKGKYLANCCLFPMQAYTKAKAYALGEFHENKFPDKISGSLERLREKITALDFYGNSLEYPYLMWLLYVWAGDIFSKAAGEKYLEKYKGKYPPDSRSYHLTVQYILPEENFDETVFGKMKTVGHSVLYQSFNTSAYGSVTFANEFEYEPFPCDSFGDDEQRRGRDGWADGNNISLLIALADDPAKKLTKYEEEQAAEFLKKGLLKKDGGGLAAQLPIIPRKVQEEICGLIASEITGLAKEYAQIIGSEAEKILLPYVRRDMMSNFLYWDMRMMFHITGGLFWYGWDKHLALPEDYSRSAAGLYIGIE